MVEGQSTSAKPPLGGLRPGGRRLAGDRGGGEVAFGIAVAAQVEVVIPGPKKATPVKVPLDPPERLLQHIAHLAGLQMSKARKERAAWPRATSSFPCSCQAPSRAMVWR